MSNSPRWWQDGVCYQVWPASYKDSNGDGLGDIPGLISTLDYIKDLGTDILWLCPMYASPHVDMGYDISDYENVYPPFGTLADMDELIKETHGRGMRLILDLVINHTSDQHAWFLESKKNRNNPKSDWYIWRDPKIVDGERQPPNNWRAEFGGCAWEYVAERDQYYLHLFETEMPDINWECREAREAIYESALRFWLRKGVDGFRVDTANLYCKDHTFLDAEVVDPESPYQPAWQLYCNGPGIHDVYKEIRREVLDEFGDVVMVGELPRTDLDELLKYVAEESKELNMVFDFDMVMLGGNWVLPKHAVIRDTLPNLKKAISKIQSLISHSKAWTTVFAENHDNPRSISRFGDDSVEFRSKSGKLLAMMLATLSGTLFLYQGQEIGMLNIPDSWGIEDIKDVDALKYWREMQQRYPDDTDMMAKAFEGIRFVGRDNARTPVQWTAGENAGFSTAKPWMRVHDCYDSVNVEQQVGDEGSLLVFWKKMLKLRKEFPELFVRGWFKACDFENERTFCFWKRIPGGEREDEAALVVLNFSGEEAQWDVPSEAKGRKLRLLAGNRDKGVKELEAEKEVDLGEKEMLEPWEGRVYLVS